jgi:hypothetical protein
LRSGRFILPPTQQKGRTMPDQRPASPLLAWTSEGTSTEIEQPAWWDAEVKRIFPRGMEGPPPSASFAEPGKDQIRAWKLEPPGSGFLIWTGGADGNDLIWAEDDAAYKNFMASVVGDTVAEGSF